MNALMRAAEPAPIELKEDDGNPAEAVTKALAELQESIGARLNAVETKAADAGNLAERLDRLEAKLNRPKVANDNDTGDGIERKAFTGYLRSGREALGADEVKALRVADDTSGGYLAIPEFVLEVDKALVEFSPVRSAARVGNTANGSVIIPKRTGTPSGYWVGETEERSATESTYGQAEIPIHEAACYVDVSVRLLEDAAINVAAEVAYDLAEEFGRMEGAVFLGGDGSKKPLGILKAPGVIHTPTGNASTLGSAPADLLITHLYSLPAFYRNRGAWMMNGTTLAAIRKFKDTTGQYLWQPAYAQGQPETILGRPVIEAVDMPDIGNGSEPIIFGDFATAYRIYDRLALSIMRDPFTRATAGLVRFHARRRVGGDVVRAEAIRKIKCATT